MLTWGVSRFGFVTVLIGNRKEMISLDHK